MKKRGRKKGQGNRWSKLPHCSRCNVRLHNGNCYKRSDGRFVTYCRTCNVDESIMKVWRGKPINQIDNQIKKYCHLIDLLIESKQMKGL